MRTRIGALLAIVMLSGAIVEAPAATTAARPITVSIPLPAPGAQKAVGLTIRETLAPGKKARPLRIRTLNDSELGNVGAAGGATAPVVRGRTATYTVLVAILNFGSYRSVAHSRSAVAIDVEFSPNANDALKLAHVGPIRGYDCDRLRAGINTLATLYSLRNRTFQPTEPLEVIKETFHRLCP